MANKKDLKAFVRYDGTGRIIAGSLILQRSKPKVGNWQQTNAYECCDPSCLPLVYNEDFIIENIVPYGVGEANIIVGLNPFTGVNIQGGLFDCNGNLITISPVLTLPYPEPNNWIVTEDQLFTSCSIKFRRICFNGNGHSDWMEPSFG